jgi:hypothetical protein
MGAFKVRCFRFERKNNQEIANSILNKLKEAFPEIPINLVNIARKRSLPDGEIIGCQIACEDSSAAADLKKKIQDNYEIESSISFPNRGCLIEISSISFADFKEIFLSDNEPENNFAYG